MESMRRDLAPANLTAWTHNFLVLDPTPPLSTLQPLLFTLEEQAAHQGLGLFTKGPHAHPARTPRYQIRMIPRLETIVV